MSVPPDTELESRMDPRLADYLVVLVGCGKMGTALASGLIDSGALDPRRLVCLDAVERRAQELADELDAREALPEVELDADGQPFRRMRIYLIAVKPKDVRAVVEQHRDEFTDEDTIVSIAAGVPLSLLRRAAGKLPGLVRAMPNTPSLIGAGVTGIMGDGTIDMQAVSALFESVGMVVRIRDEDHFDGLTGISGSGPAYIFTAIEAMADGGVLMGLDRETAIALASGVIEGAARMVHLQHGTHTAELKDRVASPGGTTIAALAALEQHGFRHALIRAVEAAALRSRQMTKEFEEDTSKGLLE